MSSIWIAVAAGMGVGWFAGLVLHASPIAVFCVSFLTAFTVTVVRES